MQNWYHIFPKNTGLSLFAWIAFCLLPFYFIIRSSSMFEIIIGILMIVLFFTTYRLSFIKQGWTVYVSVGIEMAINIGMTLYFGYVYFSLFLAFFIGNIQSRAGFIALYVVHLVTTIAAVFIGFFIQSQTFFSQIPFIILTVIGVILLPFSMYNRRKQEKLENQLEDANKRISQLMVIEERQRIARDLHDTLGQKLSLIGMKSDLAKKLVMMDQDQAKKEINDVHQTARTALKEVREMVSNMRHLKLKEELVRIQELMKAARVGVEIRGDPELTHTPLLVENIISMCLKEAATNVVKHSNATTCNITIHESSDEIYVTVQDNGIGVASETDSLRGNGLRGIKERLEFVNGRLEIESCNGMKVLIQIPMNDLG